jgi:hypothetical protein
MLFHLFRQKSRNEFLRIALEAESKRVQSTFSLVQTLQKTLVELEKDSSDRIVSRLMKYSAYA